MTFTSAHVSISLDGFVAGPDQTLDDPIGRGGHDLHRWLFGAAEAGRDVDVAWSEKLQRPRGAYVMGRNMFGPVRGEWPDDGEPWRGWWGEEPPYHAPVFVLTHHEREPVELVGTTFHFVTGGFDAALAAAREVGDGDVAIAGGASAVRQALVAGEVDELTLDVAPVLLGSGERIFDGSFDIRLEPVEVGASPLATHVRYRVLR